MKKGDAWQKRKNTIGLGEGSHLIHWWSHSSLTTPKRLLHVLQSHANNLTYNAIEITHLDIENPRIGDFRMATTMLTMPAATAQLAVSPFSQVRFTRVQSARTSVSARRVVYMAAAPNYGTSSGPAINAGDKVAEKIDQAQEICAGDNQSEECATAWNEVESAAAEKAKSKGKSGDPLEDYCEDNPDADECRVYNN